MWLFFVVVKNGVFIYPPIVARCCLELNNIFLLTNRAYCIWVVLISETVGIKEGGNNARVNELISRLI